MRRNIALVDSDKYLRELSEGTYVLGSQGGLMVRGSFGDGEMVYYPYDNLCSILPFSEDTIWGVPLDRLRVEANGSVSVVEDFCCDLHPNDGEEYLWAKHLLENMPCAGLTEGVLV